MNTTELILIANSLLLGLVGILLGMVGFFLRDLHRQFKTLVERVNELCSDLTQVSMISASNREINDKDIGHLKSRVERLEDVIINKRP